MNAFLMALRELPSMADVPAWAMLLIKLTSLLSVAWLAHLTLARANPRWRVFMWRVTAVGLISLPTVGWLLPSLEVRMARPVALEQAAITPSVLTAVIAPRPLESATEMLPPASGRGGGDSEIEQMDRVVSPQDALTLALSQEESGPASAFFTVKTLLLAAWFGGIAFWGLRLSLGHGRIWQTVRRAQQPPRWVRDECERVARAIDCRGRVEVMQSADVESPFLCGLRRPTLLLPTRMCEDSYRKDLPGIFAHELAHARSHDLRWNVGLHLLSIVLWFHPLAWRMRKTHLAACELVCDAVSAAFVGNVTDYCRTLARVAVDARTPLPAAGIAMARVSNISHRLNALKRRVFDLPLRRRSVVSFVVATLIAIGMLGTLRFALAEPEAASPIAVNKVEAKPAEEEATPAKPADAAMETGSLIINVVDDAGKPIANAKLHADCRGRKLDGVTDASGKCPLGLPSPDEGYIYLYATIDGYVPLRKHWVNQDSRDPRPAEFTFTVEKGRTIGGVVQDEQGKPVSGVKVRLSLSSQQYAEKGVAMVLWDKHFTTDSEGRWQLDHVPQRIDSLAVGLEHPDYISVPGPAGISAAEQRQVEDQTSVMVMKKGIPVAGTVTDPDGKPVADAAVTLGEWYSPKQLSVTTNEKGRYRFASLAPGNTVLTVTRPDFSPALRSINVQPKMKPVDFQLEKGNSLRVRVVDKDGKPIAGVFVTPDTWHGKRVLCDLGTKGRTDAEGRWTWTWAPKDAVQTNFGLTGLANYMSIHGLSLAPQEAEHVVTMYQALTVSGHVVDAETKQPIPRFQVISGNRQDGMPEAVHWDRREVVEGKNGQYKLMFTGSSQVHLLRIEADGYQPVVSRDFKNDEGNVTCDLALNSGKGLNVMVRLPDGKPAAEAEVCLCPEKPGKLYNMVTFVKNGRFALRDMSTPSLKTGPDGRLPIQPQDNSFLLVVVHDQGFAQTTSEELAAKPEIALQAWARLEGVVRQGTKPAPGAKLDAYPSGSNGGMRWGFLNFQDQAETDADGKFVYPKLRPGKWQVRLLPVDQAGRSPNEKSVDLAPGQTVNVTLGGEGRPVIGRLQWPEGKLPDGDLSHIFANIGLKMSEPPTPPKEVRDQGADAMRTWAKQWQESDEGKAWQKVAQQRQQSQRTVSADRSGSLQIENVLPGQYELNVVLKANTDSLPWDMPEVLQYSSEISVSEMPGGVSDEPLDLGSVPLVDKTFKKPSLTSAMPPAPQSAGEKSVGNLRDNLDLLRYVVVANRQNKAKIQTWQGKATVERRSDFGKDAGGFDYAGTVDFVFDRARKSIRWNTTLERWSKIVQGRDDSQPVPQILNGMMTPEGLYRFGSYDSPGNPKNRPLTLTIAAATFGTPHEGQLQPHLYDFNPLYYYDLNEPHGTLLDGLTSYIGMADDPRLDRIKVMREGDQVSIDMGMGDVSQRYTLSLSQGCNPIEHKTAWSESSQEYHWTYELHDDIWLPKTWTQSSHQKGGRDEQCKVTFVENVVNQPVEPAAFSLPSLGLQTGDKVQDRRTQPMNQYPYEGE